MRRSFHLMTALAVGLVSAANPAGSKTFAGDALETRYPSSLSGESAVLLVQYQAQSNAVNAASASATKASHLDANQDPTPTGSCCLETNCCAPFWAHRDGVFAEVLYLRARDAEVAYAVPIDGPIAPNSPGAQVGRTGVADLEYDTGFRVGFNLALSECGSLTAVYSHFDSASSDSITAAPPDVIRSLVFHPATANAAFDNLAARATNGVDFQLIDIDFRHVWSSSDCHVVNYVIGARYAHLDQDFHAEFENLGMSTVDSAIKFDGGGIRLGLEAERLTRRRFSIYAKSYASFVAGDFDASFQQFDVVSNTTIFNSWNAGRVVTMLDLEAGIGWVSDNCRWRATAGYLISGWHNVVKTADWIDRVGQTNYLDLSDNEVLTFDGFVGRVEFRW